MRRLALPLAVAASLGLSACGPTSTANTAKKPSTKVSRLLRAGPAQACSSSATLAERKGFVKAHSALTDEQLAWVCPDLYPNGFLTAKERAKLKQGQGITKDDGKGANR